MKEGGGEPYRGKGWLSVGPAAWRVWPLIQLTGSSLLCTGSSHKHALRAQAKVTAKRFSKNVIFDIGRKSVTTNTCVYHRKIRMV